MESLRLLPQVRKCGQPVKLSGNFSKRSRLGGLGWLRPSLSKECVLSLSIWANHSAELKAIGSIGAMFY